MPNVNISYADTKLSVYFLEVHIYAEIVNELKYMLLDNLH